MGLAAEVAAGALEVVGCAGVHAALTHHAAGMAGAHGVAAAVLGEGGRGDDA